jgi:hypothetical protein
VLISAPKAIFELIVFLLLHDAVNADDRRICCLSCETSFAHGWHISIQSLSLERHKDHRYNSQVRFLRTVALIVRFCRTCCCGGRCGKAFASLVTVLGRVLRCVVCILLCQFCSEPGEGFTCGGAQMGFRLCDPYPPPVVVFNQLYVVCSGTYL